MSKVATLLILLVGLCAVVLVPYHKASSLAASTLVCPDGVPQPESPFNCGPLGYNSTTNCCITGTEDTCPDGGTPPENPRTCDSGVYDYGEQCCLSEEDPPTPAEPPTPDSPPAK